MYVKVRHGSYDDVLSHVKADLIFTSPPYNIGSGGLRRDGQRRSGKFDAKSFAGVDGYPDAMPEEEYQDSQVKFLYWCEEHLAKNGTIIYNHKIRRKNKTMIHPLSWIMRVTSLVVADEIVWDRGSGHNHDKTMMHPQTERLWALRRPGDKYCLNNTRDLPQRTDVWRLSRAANIGHCAPFSEQIAEAVVKAWSAPGQLVVDPYLGSGTTGVVAKRLGRRFEGSELLDKFYRMAKERVGV